MSSALSAIGRCNFTIFLIPRTKKGYKSPRNTCVFVLFSLGTQSPAWVGFWQSCIQIGMIFSRKTANSPQKVARQCLKVSQRTPRLRKSLSKDAKELLKSAPVDLRELLGSPTMLLRALRMRKTFIQRLPGLTDNIFCSPSACQSIQILESWNPGSSNSPSLGRRNARSD